MRRPTLLSRPNLPNSADGDRLDGQTSPPATWEDRADGEFDSSANWMDTGEPPSHSCTGDALGYASSTQTVLALSLQPAHLHLMMHADDLDEDGTVLTASPEPEGSTGGTPDLLADSPPKHPDAPSPNASRVTPRVLFPALFPTPTSPPAPSTQAPTSPTAAAGLPPHTQETETSLQSRDCSSPRRRSFEKEASAEQEQEPAPVGCYSTLAAHHREEPRGVGHELPACFASPPTSPPQTARGRHSEEPMDTISLADGPPAAPASAAHSAAPKVTVIGAVKRPEADWPEDDCNVSAASEKAGGGGSAKAAGTPMAGLRDLFGPMGGLFKGAFSQPASGTSADGERQEGHQAQEGAEAGPHAAAAGRVGLNGEAAEGVQSEQPVSAGPASELTQALIAALPRRSPSNPQGQKLPRVTRLAGGNSMSSTSKGLPSSSGEAVGGQVEAGPRSSAVKLSTVPTLHAHPERRQSMEQPSARVPSGDSQQAASAGSLLAADEPSADSDSMGAKRIDSVGLGQYRTGERAAGSDSSNKQIVPTSVDARHPSTQDLQDAALTGREGLLHTDVLEHEAHVLSSSNLEHSKDEQEASAAASMQAPSSHAHTHHSDLLSAYAQEGGTGVTSSMRGGSSHKSGPAQRPFRGRHRR